jgi:hypothetical protein
MITTGGTGHRSHHIYILLDLHFDIRFDARRPAQVACTESTTGIIWVERRASPPGWTGETPVPPPWDPSRGQGTSS